MDQTRRRTGRRTKRDRLRAWAELMGECLPSDDDRLPADEDLPDFTSTALRQPLSGPSDKRR
jgi:hypothetical protein